MTEPTGIFIEHDEVVAHIAEGARVGNVQYRMRPKDTGCLHSNAPGTPAGQGHIDIVCLDCGMRWLRVKPWVPATKGAK